MWVSRPVEITVGDGDLYGVTRPPLGSDRVFYRLLSDAGAAHAGIALYPTLLLRPYGARLDLTLKNGTSGPIDRRIKPRGGIVIVRDSKSGVTMLPCDDDGAREPYWGSTIGGAPMLAPGDAAANDSAYLDGRHLRPGRTYTVLAAATFDRETDHVNGTTTVVAPPIGFREAEPYINANHAPAPLNGAGHLPAPLVEQTPEKQWKLLSRFSGRAFGGLLLKAALKGTDSITVELRNQTRESSKIVRWNGESEYDIILRDCAGRFMPMTEKGKRFFNRGKFLDIRWLKAGQSTVETFSLCGLFETRVPGDYTALISLPVFGQVDAVLTAAPITVNVPKK